MILIISEDTDDVTNNVIYWLLARKKTFKRINYSELSNTNLTIDIQNVGLNLAYNDFEDIKVVWHRRGRLNLLPRDNFSEYNLRQYLKADELFVLKAAEFFSTNNVKYIGGYTSENENNKLIQLQLASSVGLFIPGTLVTTAKSRLLAFLNKHKKVITKDIRKPANIKLTNGRITSVGTFLITQEMVSSMSDNFCPLLIQEYIEKEFEIRIFFFEKTFYYMAIFSQKNAKTLIDYRNYATTQQNKFVPFLLPKDIEHKVKNYVSLTGLNTGSIDMIKSKSGDYYFLEVNPQGQFGWVSEHCNYKINQDIANFLIAEYEK